MKNSENSKEKMTAQGIVGSAARLLTVASLLTTVLAILLFGFLHESASGQNAFRNDSREEQEAADWKPVEQALGKSGILQPGGVFKINLPRHDLNVTVGGVRLKPALALGSWVAFKRMGRQAMVMGDLVLTEDEVSAVMMKLQAGGIEQTALHNHVLDESPRVMYMHISGRGDPVKMARSIHAALALSKTPFTTTSGGAQSQSLDINTEQIERIIGRSGKANGGVYQFSIARAEKIMDNGMEVPPAMGVATAINFQPTGDRRAAITGDFVLVASEVNPVIRALRENGIEVTALHSHMLNETPRLFFMHFWANNNALNLARGIRAALDKTNSAKTIIR